MEAVNLGFLDETSVSQSIKSPIKTSTAAKENIKWNENIFFQRQDLAQASESLFLPTESPIVSNEASKEVIPQEFISKLKFNLNDYSYASEGTNSSLGILNVENLTDLSETSFQKPSKVHKKTIKKKLKRNPRVTFDKDFGNETIEVSKDIPKNFSEETSGATSDGSSSTSDIEFDGTNIPELNIDCDILSLIKSDKADFSLTSAVNASNGSEFGHTFTNVEMDNTPSSDKSFSASTTELLKHDSTSGESSSNMRQSIFENFSPSYEHLSFVKTGTVSGNINEKSSEKIRVCPFLGVSSFEVEPILQKCYDANNSSEIENIRDTKNNSVDFCPQQISARSSSFKSSGSETSKFSDKGNQNTFIKEDFKNEVLSGSCFQTSEMKIELHLENGENNEDSSFAAKSELSSNSKNNYSTENIIDTTGISDLVFQTNLQSENISSFLAEGDDWCSRLGISESDFFSSESAKELLKKDKEAFEKEHIFELGNSKISVSDWSPPNDHDKQHSGRQVSIGTLISARSENVGTLSENKERERPYFGTSVITPPKENVSRFKEFADPSDSKTSIDAYSENKSIRNIRFSALSEILEDISITDPMNFASKIVEKCAPAIQEDSTKLLNSHESLNTNFQQSVVSEEQFSSTISAADIEDSNSTFVKSASNNSLSKQTIIVTDGELKSTASELHSLNNSLNFSVDSSSERESIKTDKYGTCSNCSMPASQHDSSQEYTRPTSSCSSTCNNLLSLGNAFNIQYGCMKYLNSGSEENQNGLCNLIQTGNPSLPCPHVCTQHALQHNLLSIGVPNSFQPAFQNTLSGPLLISGNPALQIEIHAPPELCFPEKIALGDSQEMNLTIRNSASVSCYYTISYISAYLNDSPLPFELSGLSYNKTVPCNVGSATDIKLILSPKYEGKIEVNLQIDAFLNAASQRLNVTPGAITKTKIFYEAIQPSISIQYKGKNVLNLGSVIAGSTFMEYVTVINNCEVPVPLRISLCNESLENQIYFGLKEMDRQKHPANKGPRFLSSKVLLYRIPASKDKSLPSSLNIPIVFESINSNISSSVTAAIETPTLCEVLAFLKILASVGSARLLLKDNNQNPLVLKTCKGATCSHSVTVINEGILPVVYDIHIDGDSDVLSVSPNSLNLQPKQCTIISVTFTPQACDNVKGSLLAAAQPHGQVFTVTEIIGYAKENCYMTYRNNNLQTQYIRPTRDSIDSTLESTNFVECNKKYLAWGGNDVGSFSFKTFTLRNPGLEPIHVKLFIKEKSQSFLLIDESNQKTASFKLMVDSKEEKNLSVIFMPKSVESYSGLLCIKSVTRSDSRVFSIRLSGYGGTSKIKVLGLSDGEGTGHSLEIEPSAGDVYKNITLYNTGLRPAFVKLLISYDGLVQNPAAKQTVINPSEFVLLENEKKNILISVNCSGRNLISNNEVISILYGDEILRQLFRRNLNTNPSRNESAYNINFNVPYDGENRVLYDSSYGSSPKDEALFYSSLKKLIIPINFNGQNTTFSRMSFVALSEVEDSFANMTLDSTVPSNSTLNSKLRRLTIEGSPLPVKESVIHNMNRLSLSNHFDALLLKSMSTDPSPSSIVDDLQNLKFDSWIVHPEELVIDTDNKDKRILLKSYSDSDMRFKVECTIDVITVSPLTGILSAKGEIGLRLTLINPNHNKLIEDYYGNIKIMCGGVEKIVVVKILRNHGRPRNCPILNESLRSGFLGNSDFLDNTVVECISQSISVENMKNFPKVIDLQKTKQDVLSETTLIITNPSKDIVVWNIHPISMLFIQPFDDSINCPSSTFEFVPTSGTFKPMESSNLVLKFLPCTAAQFSQFFEIIMNFEDGTKHTCNIKVQGEAVADLPINTEANSSDVKNKRQTITIKKRVKAEIFAESDICKFPNTISGQKSKAAITIKNISLQDIKLTVIKPRLPFIINCSSYVVKSKKYIKLPAVFKPTKSGNYENDVKFICENGYELTVKLSGSCL